jgi:hypothetical protein
MVVRCPDCGTATLHPVCPACRVKREQERARSHVFDGEIDAFVRDLEIDLDLLERFAAATEPPEIDVVVRRWRDLPALLRERSDQRPLYWID